MTINTGKTCCVCGTDVSQKQRTKDDKGRYYCEPCRVSLADPRSQAPDDAGLVAVTESSGRAATPSPEPRRKPIPTNPIAVADPKPHRSKSILITSVVMVLIVGAIAAFFLTRSDPWETSHRDAIKAMKTSGDTLVQAGQLAEAKAKYDELLKLVQSHQFKDRDLARDIDNTKASLQTLNVTIATAERLRQAEEKKQQDAAKEKQRIESEAQARIEAERTRLRPARDVLLEWAKLSHLADVHNEMANTMKLTIDDLVTLGRIKEVQEEVPKAQAELDVAKKYNEQAMAAGENLNRYIKDLNAAANSLLEEPATDSDLRPYLRQYAN